jgi:PPM family protein phosphatase
MNERTRRRSKATGAADNNGEAKPDKTGSAKGRDNSVTSPDTSGAEQAGLTAPPVSLLESTPVGQSSANPAIIAPTPQRLVSNQVEIAFLSNVGRVRTNNEDSFSAFLGSVPRLNSDNELLFSFLAVADGMGGHEDGEVASNIAVRKMTEGVLRNFYLPTVEGRQPGRNGESPLEALAFLIEDANQAILQEAHQNRVSMGTTLTCAVLIGQTAVIGHVGDSRLYVLEKSSGKLRQATHDHSVVQRLVDMGTLTPEEAQNSPQRSVLYLTLGQKSQIDPEVEIVQLGDVAALLICSDGLWELVEDSAIESLFKQANSAAEVCGKLIEAANAAGGVDNVTAIVAKF